ERITLPEELPEPDPNDPIVQHLLDGIHRALGISYYKTSLPPHILAEPVPAEDAAFWDELYTLGLGEFFYQNRIDPRGRIAFPAGGEPAAPVICPPGEERVLVLAGGGKDSAVAREVVRHAGVPADALTLGESDWIRQSVRAMGLNHRIIHRTIDPTLFELNRRGALNGHVPISACIAFIATLVAYVGNYTAVIAANERSANEANLQWNGQSINHQWSKSLAFEAAFQDWCARRMRNGPVYFSLLRPLSELHITEAFARHSDYFDHFTSCNANFRIRPNQPAARWCGQCPKCVFVQLALAPHLTEADVNRIFGHDFIADADNLHLVQSLCGLNGTKPFECVGTAGESRAALGRLHRDGRLAEPVRTWCSEHIRHAGEDWRTAMTLEASHRMPAPWQERLHAYLQPLP
ncbi:MAG: endonuclease domain-containing protein, partial [Verrucomicrobiota bacterium]